MASLLALRPLTQPAKRLTIRLAKAGLIQKRALNAETAPLMYSAHATVRGARNGHVDGENLKVDLTMAKKFGGSGDAGKTNPEELFAAGYGACFQAAMNMCALKMGVSMPQKTEDSVVETTVHLVGDPKALDMGIRVDMTVKVRGLKETDLQKVIEEAKKVCPYSRAIEGNVPTTFKVEQL